MSRELLEIKTQHTEITEDNLKDVEKDIAEFSHKQQKKYNYFIASNKHVDVAKKYATKLYIVAIVFMTIALISSSLSLYFFLTKPQFPAYSTSKNGSVILIEHQVTNIEALKKLLKGRKIQEQIEEVPTEAVVGNSIFMEVWKEYEEEKALKINSEPEKIQAEEAVAFGEEKISGNEVGVEVSK